MPIYEYRCGGCGHEFEQLVRTGDTPECPSCKGQTLERLLSHVAVSSEHTRSLNFNRARASRQSRAARQGRGAGGVRKEAPGGRALTVGRLKAAPARPAPTKT